MKKNGGRVLKICFTHEKNGGKFGTPKKPKTKSSQHQNPFCPNCRRHFFLPEKSVPAPFGVFPGHFFRGPEKSKNCPNFAYFPWWAHGPYSPGLGPLLLSTRGGAIGIPNSGLATICSCSGAGLATRRVFQLNAAGMRPRHTMQYNAGIVEIV